MTVFNFGPRPETSDLVNRPQSSDLVNRPQSSDLVNRSQSSDLVNRPQSSGPVFATPLKSSEPPRKVKRFVLIQIRLISD